MRKLSIMAWLAAALLAGCGGDSSSITGEGTPPPTGGSSTPATVAVTSSATTIASDGSTSATITATVQDAANNAVSGATVTFTASAGALTVVSATTNPSGVATATLAAGTAAAGTAITVSATSGTVSGKVAVTVADTQQTINVITSLPQIPSDSSKSATITALVRDAQNQFVPGVTVTFAASSGGLTVTQATTNSNGAATATLEAAGDPSDRIITVTAMAGSTSAKVSVQVVGTTLTVAGATNLVLGAQGTYTVALTDAGGNGIPNQAVALTSAKGNTLSAKSVTTGANGQVTFTVTAVNGGTDTISATALGLTATASIAVSTQNFAFTSPAAANAKVNIGSTSTLTVVWTASGVPQAGQTVSFSASRGTLSAPTAVTDGTGTASVTISSATSGPSLVSATATGVTAEASLDFIATTPAAIALQASPSTVETQGQSTLTATVRDANNNLVEGQTVDFSITQDSTGGSLSVPSAVTNVQGQATSVYTATATSSASNGVAISATVAGTAVAAATTLTVGGEAVFLSLGTGNTLSAYSTTQYEYPYSVQAVDAAGNGVNNVTVNFTVTSLGYFKGKQEWTGTDWVPDYMVSPTIANTDPDLYTIDGQNGCLSEDLLNNGIYIASEDYNGNGKLDPGLVVSTDVGSAVTANGGSAAVNLIYPKDHAYWVAVKLTATAIVSGNQSSASTSFILQGLASDYNTQDVSPPGPNSPYGIATQSSVPSGCKNPN